MPETLTCGRALASMLRDYGIDHVFGIPGVHTIELYKGLAESGIRHVTPRHEQGAGFMADGFARASGRPAACFVVTGPGLTNILTPMGQAYADSVPMLVISGVNRREHLGLGEGRLHELKSQQSMAASVAAASFTVVAPEQLPHVLDRAFALFAAERPRPVHIELPLDVMVAPAAFPLHRRFVAPSRPGPDADALGEAATLLWRAKTPIIVVGGGAASAGNELRRIVDWLDIPVATTINALGVLPADHPALIGSNLAEPALFNALRSADLVLAVGTELGETEMYPEPKGLAFTGDLIRIDIDPSQTVRGHPARLAIQSDARLALGMLAELVERHEKRPPGQGSDLARRIREVRARSMSPEHAMLCRLMARLKEALPAAIWVGDSTQPVYAANQFFVPDRPRSFFNSSTGFGTLGYGLPAAIGAKLAAPDRPVVALIGDGGFLFTVSELASAVEAQASVVILLWNNGGYGEIRKCMLAERMAPLGVDLYRVDFLALARAFGCDAARAKSLDHLVALVRDAMTARLPVVIEIEESEALDW